MPFKPHPTDPDKMVLVAQKYDLLRPKREWVGLTDAEVMGLALGGLALGYDVPSIVIRAVEAKLKEKNHAN